MDYPEYARFQKSLEKTLNDERKNRDVIDKLNLLNKKEGKSYLPMKTPYWLASFKLLTEEGDGVLINYLICEN